MPSSTSPVRRERLTDALRQEMTTARVRVGVVEAGAVDTELLSNNSDQIYTELLEPFNRNPVRLVPEDIAGGIAFMVTRPWHAAVAEILVLPSDQTWSSRPTTAMPDRTPDQLETIASTPDLFVSPYRQGGTTYGTPQTWALVVEVNVYVRAANGQPPRWYQAAIAQHAGTTRSRGASFPSPCRRMASADGLD